MRLAFALAGAATMAAVVVAATMVWLCLTQPAIVAGTVAKGDPWSLVLAAASFVVSALVRVLHQL